MSMSFFKVPFNISGCQATDVLDSLTPERCSTMDPVSTLLSKSILTCAARNETPAGGLVGGGGRGR